ncbi:MAG: hypothetical protein JSV92_01220 [archaeon]|nr:MAG: hypothetical protein JSV92_01220 [archaeon]
MKRKEFTTFEVVNMVGFLLLGICMGLLFSFKPDLVLPGVVVGLIGVATVLFNVKLYGKEWEKVRSSLK